MRIVFIVGVAFVLISCDSSSPSSLDSFSIDRIEFVDGQKRIYSVLATSTIYDADGNKLLKSTVMDSTMVVEVKSSSISHPMAPILLESYYPRAPQLRTSHWYNQTKTDLQLVETLFETFSAGPGPLLKAALPSSGIMLQGIIPSSLLTNPFVVLNYPLESGKNWITQFELTGLTQETEVTGTENVETAAGTFSCVITKVTSSIAIQQWNYISKEGLVRRIERSESTVFDSSNPGGSFVLETTYELTSVESEN